MGHPPLGAHVHGRERMACLRGNAYPGAPIGPGVNDVKPLSLAEIACGAGRTGGPLLGRPA